MKYLTLISTLWSQRENYVKQVVVVFDCAAAGWFGNAGR
jgi:hypothetical protein